MVGDFVAKATELSNALQHTVNHLQTIQQELERSNPVAALQIKLEFIKSTKDRFEALEAALSRHSTSVSGDTLVEKLENIRIKIVDKNFTQLKNWNLSNNVIASTQEEIGNILAILQRWNTAKSKIKEVQGAVEANDKDSATTLLDLWTPPGEEDADTLTTLVEDFAAAVRLYVRVLNRFPDTPSILKVVPGEVGNAKGSLKGKIQFDKETPIGPFYGVFNTKVGDDNTATNEDVYRHPEIGVRNAINDVYAGRDVVVLGYGVSGSGKSYTLLGEQSSDTTKDKNGIAQMFLEEFAKTEKFKQGKHTISMCVKELYGTTPSLHPDIGSALMSGSIYEYAPTVMIQKKNLKNPTTSTIIEYEAERDRRRKRNPKHTIRAVTSDTIDTVRHSYNDDQTWDVVAVSSPQSIEDITEPVAHGVNAVDLACSLDPCKFVGLTNPLADFKKVYQKVQDLRSSRKLKVKQKSKLFYGEAEVGVKTPFVIRIDFDKLNQALVERFPNELVKFDEASRNANKMFGAEQKRDTVWEMPLDKHGDEGFMTSTERDDSNNPTEIILPRVYQHPLASVSFRDASVETLRNFDHEKSTPNNPRSSRGILFLVFRIQLEEGKVAHLTIADFPGVEDPTAIARAFGPGKFDTEEQALSRIRYHPPFTQFSRNDDWTYGKETDIVGRKVRDPFTKTEQYVEYDMRKPEIGFAGGRYSRRIESVTKQTLEENQNISGYKTPDGDVIGTFKILKTKNETTKFSDYLEGDASIKIEPSKELPIKVTYMQQEYKIIGTTRYKVAKVAILQRTDRTTTRTPPKPSTHSDRLRIKCTTLLHNNKQILVPTEWLILKSVLAYQEPVPLTPDEFKTVREGQYINTMLAHLKAFIAKSSGQTSSWCTSHDTASIDWQNNPAFYWSNSIERIFPFTSLDGSNAVMQGSRWKGYIPTRIKVVQVMVPEQDLSTTNLKNCTENQHIAQLFAGPFLSSADMWVRQIKDNNSNLKLNSLNGENGVGQKTTDRAVFELTRGHAWFKWFQTLDANGFTNEPEPTRGNVLLIELLSALTSAKSVNSEKNERRAKLLRKDPKIIVMNMLRTDDDGQSRGDAIRDSANYTNSLRVDMASGLPEKLQVCGNHYPFKNIPVSPTPLPEADLGDYDHTFIPEHLFRAWAALERRYDRKPIPAEEIEAMRNDYTVLLSLMYYHVQYKCGLRIKSTYRSYGPYAILAAPEDLQAGKTEEQKQKEQAAQARAAALKTGLAALEEACTDLGPNCQAQMMSQFEQYLNQKYG